VTERFTLNIGPGDRLLWVLEKLELAALCLEAADAPIHVRLERALLQMHAVKLAELPNEFREQLAPIRDAMRPGASFVMTTAEAEAVGQAILGLRDEVRRLIDLRA
jgi:hypothetical protein